MTHDQAVGIGISIHALREEGDDVVTAAVVGLRISIHALREEGDERRGKSPGVFLYFYPRPPRGGRHRAAERAGGLRDDFYPRPPRGGRQG